MNIGCIYNKSNNTCRFNKIHSSIDNNCELKSDGCHVKIHPFQGWISGPISAYSILYNNKRYLLFGDEHHSMDKSCDNCNDIDVSCYDISRLIRDIIQNKGTYEFTDIYLEHPFMTVVPRDLPDIGYISEIYNVFKDCFRKNRSCKHSYNTRFHYVDIRKSHEQPLIFEEYVTNIRLSKVYGEIKYYEQPDTEYIITTDILMEALYGHTFLADKLFKIYIESDNYVEDTYKLFYPTLKKIRTLYTDSNIELDYIINILMYKNKIRKQLYGLEQDGLSDMADNIRAYIYEIYNKGRKETQSIYKVWKTTMNMFYNNSITSKQLLNMLDISTQITTQITYLLMDIYTLARMFRKFKSGNRKHIESNDVIIYAGNAHIQTYVNFFKYISDNVQIDEYSGNGRCLNVDLNMFI